MFFSLLEMKYNIYGQQKKAAEYILILYKTFQ